MHTSASQEQLSDLAKQIPATCQLTPMLQEVVRKNEPASRSGEIAANLIDFLDEKGISSQASMGMIAQSIAAFQGEVIQTTARNYSLPGAINAVAHDLYGLANWR